MYSKFKEIKLVDPLTDRPLLTKYTEDEFYTFTSSPINRTLNSLIRFSGTKDHTYVESNSSFIFKKGIKNYKLFFMQLQKSLESFEDELKKDLDLNPEVYESGKWSKYLNTNLKAKLLINNFYDVQGTYSFLQDLNINC